MANKLGTTGWDKFRSAMTDAHDTFHQKSITWKRLKSKLNLNGEDNTGNGYIDVDLKVQLNYNYMRTWPISFRTETGDLDRQSVQILINKTYLAGLGYINASGYFLYDPSQDLFVIDGLIHTPVGDTPASQAYEDDILFTIIVKREEGKTGAIR